jgi:hypothetical protein
MIDVCFIGYELYSFYSHCGPKVGFRFTEDDRLVLIFEHSTYQPTPSGKKAGRRR